MPINSHISVLKYKIILLLKHILLFFNTLVVNYNTYAPACTAHFNTRQGILLKKTLEDRRNWCRQYSVDRYILDFYCPIYKLCIELDGQDHYTMQGDTRDYDRSIFLNSKGIEVIRFENKDIWENIEQVLETIKSNLQDRKKTLP